MRQMVVSLGIVSLAVSVALAAGYKIPEQSVTSVAMSAANIASADSADASYYNPANMAWMGTDQIAEIGMTYIGLPKVKYSDTTSAAKNGESKQEHFLVPSVHYVGPKFGDWRFGLSVVAPAGLSKRWDSAYEKAFAEEFTLKTIELNPTVSYKLSDKLAVALGVRAVHSEGVVKSSGAVSRDMTGDSMDYGYNLAVSYAPLSNFKLAATYRSNVDLTVVGDAKLYSGTILAYNGGVNVSVPLPATLNIAMAYTFGHTIAEAVYEKTYWSKYKQLDFNYPTAIPAGLVPYFDTPVSKNWKDSDTYRLGIKHKYSDKLDLMTGFAIDKTPVPDSTLGFELLDSDAKVYSCGAIYKINNKTSIGLAYLYDDKEKRTVSNTTVKGTTSGGGAHLARFSVITKF